LFHPLPQISSDEARYKFVIGLRDATVEFTNWMVALSYTASGLFEEKFDWDWKNNKEIVKDQRDFPHKILVHFCSNNERPKTAAGKK